MIKHNGLLKHISLALIDAGLVVAALALGLLLRFEGSVPSLWLDRLETLLLPAAIINLASFYIFGLYRRVWRYAGIDELLLIVLAVSAGLSGTYLYSYFFEPLPRSVYIIAWFLLIFFIGGSRLAVRLLADLLSRPVKKGKYNKALIVGAGEAGVLVARELKKHGSRLAIKIVGFIDDDQAKQRQIIQGLPVLGNRQALPELIEQHSISEVVIAMPSAPYRVLQEIVCLCEDYEVKIKTIPGIFEIIEGQVSLNTLKEVEIEDLLRRPPVKLDLGGIQAYLAEKTVLVTGAGGSIGLELCRQIALVGPEKLILLDHDENGIFYTDLELSKKYKELKIVPLVCDIKEYEVFNNSSKLTGI